MTDKVILSIKGTQHEFGEDGVTEVITTGNYYFRNGKHYIVYDELIPDTGEQVSSTLKMTPNRIDMIKHGSHSATWFLRRIRKICPFTGRRMGLWKCALIRSVWILRKMKTGFMHRHSMHWKLTMDSFQTVR